MKEYTISYGNPTIELYLTEEEAKEVLIELLQIFLPFEIKK